MLAFIGAMEEETEGILSALSDPKTEEHAGRTVTEGTYYGKRAVVVQAGIGKVSAALCTQMIIDRYAPSGIVNTGVAGSLSADIAIGDLVIAADAVEADMDVSALGYAPGQIPGLDTLYFQADRGLCRLAEQAAAKALPELTCHRGRIVSGDQFVASGKKKKWLKETFAGDCCEMEGAAIAHVCHINRVPFLIVRAISDSADGSAKIDYPAFEKAAARSSVRLSLAMIAASEM